jgi:hypothetical protein
MNRQIESDEERQFIVEAVENGDSFRRLYDHYLPLIYA